MRDWPQPRHFYMNPMFSVAVTPEMTIYNDEIFEPQLAVILYSTEKEARRLPMIVFLVRLETSLQVPAIRATLSPIGGFKQFGIGRYECIAGIEEYLEFKSVYGFEEEAKQLPAFG